MELTAPRRATQRIDRTVSCSRNDPSGRVGRDARAAPPIAGHGERVLDGVFGERDVAEDPNQRCHRLAVHVAEHALNFRLHGDSVGHALTRPVARNGRTSIGWLMASTTLLAQANAASRSSALMM